MEDFEKELVEVWDFKKKSLVTDKPHKFEK